MVTRHELYNPVKISIRPIPDLCCKILDSRDYMYMGFFYEGVTHFTEYKITTRVAPLFDHLLQGFQISGP